MLYILWNIFAFIITAGILITIHELGHFTAARLCGVTVQRFSIGFGYILWKFQDKKNTEYVISAIPLGGYVKMLSKNDIPIKENHKKSNQIIFEDKTIYERILIIAAGPIFNIIFSFLIYWFIFSIGITVYRPIIEDVIPNSIASKHKIPRNIEIHAINDIETPDWESVQFKLLDIVNNQNIKTIIMHTTPVHSSQVTKYIINITDWKYNANTQNIITSLGLIPISTYKIYPIITKIQKNSEAMTAGLRIGDEIISINDKTVTTWAIFTQEIKNNPEKTLQITIKRENKTLTLQIKPNKKNTTNNEIEGYIGILPKYLPTSKEYTTIKKFQLVESFQKSGEKVLKLIHITLNMLYKLIIGEIKLNNLGGPLSIAQTARTAAEYGLIPYLMFLSLISINLAIINLLPLPILDGGYLCLLVIETIAGKKISEKIEKYTYHLGIILLILLMCISIFNDLSRLQ